MISDQRAAVRSGSTHCSSAAVMASTTPVWRAASQSGPAGLQRPSSDSPPSCWSISRNEPPVSAGWSCMLVKPSSSNWPTMRMPRDSTSGPAGRVLVALGDHHVATVAAPALEVPLGRRALDDRADDLQELPADRDDHVVQPELADVGIAVADLDVEHRPQVGQHGVEVTSDQCDLSEAEPRHRHHPFSVHRLSGVEHQRPWNTGRRLSTKARKASAQSADFVMRRWASVSSATSSANVVVSAAT